ncbi:hypothetical protein SCHPADRAFT_849077 [Schizopora paradoxa]|uniref:Uncharacterized protein n=1 Tax=Schizopora paradoxa TaxID=27342 RepID=A0A0H2RV59_9AGAM|nr:hypothetical protein SCHPADRAFT_849077 [Schizopora paradoxa]
MNGQKSFWFPSMNIPDITQALDDWGLRVSEDQIKKPTGEVVQSIYMVVLQQLTGISRDVLQEPVNRALGAVDDFPELYQNSLNLNLLLTHVTRLAAAARVADFSIKDLVFPEQDRTRSILSAIINFIKFCEEREEFLSKLRVQSTAALEERERVGTQVVDLQRKIAEIKQQRLRDEPRCQQLRDENAKLTKGLIEAKNAQAALLNEFNTLKKNKSALNTQKENLIKEVELITNSITSIRSRIVQSPDRIKKHISEMGLVAQDERSAVNTIEAKTRELKTKLDALGVFEQDVKMLNDILQSVYSEHTQMEELYQRLQAFKAELDSKRILKDQLVARDDRAKRQMNNAKEKLERTQENILEKRAKSENKIKELKKQYEIMSEERRENDKVVEETKQEADELERKMLEHLRKNENELNALLAEYWNLRHQTDVYMETLANKLGIEVSS